MPGWWPRPFVVIASASLPPDACNPSDQLGGASALPFFRNSITVAEGPPPLSLPCGALARSLSRSTARLLPAPNFSTSRATIASSGSRSPHITNTLPLYLPPVPRDRRAGSPRGCCLWPRAGWVAHWQAVQASEAGPFNCRRFALSAKSLGVATAERPFEVALRCLSPTQIAREITEMSEIQTAYPDNFTEEKKMSAVAEASMLLGELAEPHPPSRKALFSRMTKLVRRYAGYDLSPGRAEDIWRQEARRVDAEEMDAIRAAKQRHQEDQARAQANALAAIYLSRAARLRQTDEAFHCEEIARLERAAGALGAVSRP